MRFWAFHAEREKLKYTQAELFWPHLIPKKLTNESKKKTKTFFRQKFKLSLVTFDTNDFEARRKSRVEKVTRATSEELSYNWTLKLQIGLINSKMFLYLTIDRHSKNYLGWWRRNGINRNNEREKDEHEIWGF